MWGKFLWGKFHILWTKLNICVKISIMLWKYVDGYQESSIYFIENRWLWVSTFRPKVIIIVMFKLTYSFNYYELVSVLLCMSQLYGPATCTSPPWSIRGWTFTLLIVAHTHLNNQNCISKFCHGCLLNIMEVVTCTKFK
jgi:hypothetical protein